MTSTETTSPTTLTAASSYSVGQDLIDAWTPAVDVVWSVGSVHQRETVMHLPDGTTLRVLVVCSALMRDGYTEANVQRLGREGWHDVARLNTRAHQPHAYAAHDDIARVADTADHDPEGFAQDVDSSTRTAADLALGYAAQTLGLRAPDDEPDLPPSASS